MVSAFSVPASSPTTHKRGPSWFAERQNDTDLNSRRVVKFFEHLANQSRSKVRQILTEADVAAEAVGLDDELLDLLAAGVRDGCRRV